MNTTEMYQWILAEARSRGLFASSVWSLAKHLEGRGNQAGCPQIGSVKHALTLLSAGIVWDSASHTLNWTTRFRGRQAFLWWNVGTSGTITPGKGHYLDYSPDESCRIMDWELPTLPAPEVTGQPKEDPTEKPRSLMEMAVDDLDGFSPRRGSGIAGGCLIPLTIAATGSGGLLILAKMLLS